MATIPNLKAKIKELETLVVCNKHIIRCARTVSTNDQFFYNSVSRLRKQIDLLSGQLQQLLTDRTEAPEVIEGATQRIHALNGKIKLLKHQRAIEQLLALQKKLEEATDD